MFNCVLFDLDGTLSPTLPARLEAFQRTFYQFGQQPSDQVILDSCFRDHTKIETLFGIPRRAFESALDLALQDTLANPKLFKGALEVLHFCLRYGVPAGIVSSGHRDTVEHLLDDLAIGHLFQTVVTGNDVTHLKPDPEPVLLALYRLGVEPGQALFIGDACADIFAGRAAGVATGLFFPAENARFHSFVRLFQARPQFVFDELAQVHDLLMEKAQRRGLSPAS